MFLTNMLQPQTGDVDASPVIFTFTFFGVSCIDKRGLLLKIDLNFFAFHLIVEAGCIAQSFQDVF